jgi:hypothetical protein
MNIRTFLTGGVIGAALLLAACDGGDSAVPQEMNAATELNMMDANAEDTEWNSQATVNKLLNEDIGNAAMANAG